MWLVNHSKSLHWWSQFSMAEGFRFLHFSGWLILRHVCQKRRTIDVEPGRSAAWEKNIATNELTCKSLHEGLPQRISISKQQNNIMIWLVLSYGWNDGYAPIPDLLSQAAMPSCKCQNRSKWQSRARQMLATCLRPFDLVTQWNIAKLYI